MKSFVFDIIQVTLVCIVISASSSGVVSAQQILAAIVTHRHRRPASLPGSP
jgi:hypothetical protein